MYTSFRKLALTVVFAAVMPFSLQAETVEVDAEKLDRLERRLAELEARLAEQEQETKKVKTLASSSAAAGSGNSSILGGNSLTYDILADSAWRNLRWTQEEQWAGIRKGVTEEKVIELLGDPPRSLESLKPRVDKVFWYETSLRSSSDALRGKISFRDGKVIYFDKPNFQAVQERLKQRAESR